MAIAMNGGGGDGGWHLREWDSLCCSFGTGLSDVEDDPLMFHHSFRAFR